MERDGLGEDRMKKTMAYKGVSIDIKSIRKSLSKSLKMDVTKVPLMMWRWIDTPTDILILLERERLYRKAVKHRGEPMCIELFFHGQGIDGPEDIYGCCIDSSLVDKKITDEYISSWEFKFPKKGFSIVVNWGA